jgi:hypothetical protein
MNSGFWPEIEEESAIHEQSRVCIGTIAELLGFV